MSCILHCCIVHCCGSHCSPWIFLCWRLPITSEGRRLRLLLPHYNKILWHEKPWREKDLFWLKVRGKVVMLSLPPKNRAVNAMCSAHTSCHIILSQTGSRRCWHPQDNPSQVCLVLACLLGDSRACKLKISMSHHSRDSVLEWWWRQNDAICSNLSHYTNRE